MLASMLSLRGTESSFSCGFFHELYGDSWESLATIVPGTWAMPLLKPVPTLPFVFCQLARLTCLTDGVLLPCKWFSYTGVKMSQASSSLAVAHPGVFGSTHKHCRYRHLPAQQQLSCICHQCKEKDWLSPLRFPGGGQLLPQTARTTYQALWKHT